MSTPRHTELPDVSALIPSPRQQPMTRRRVLKAGAVLGAAAGTGLLTAAPASAGISSIQQRSARTADSLLDSLGVVVVTSTKDGVWGKRDVLADRLQELGIRYVRTGLFPNNTGQLDYLHRLGDQGIRFNVVMGQPFMPEATPESLVRLASQEVPGLVASFEGPNEWNMTYRPNWAAEVRNWQARLYSAIKTDPRVGDRPVLMPSTGLRTGYTDLGNLNSMCDVGNLHLYTGGFLPSIRIDDMLQDVKVCCGSKPVMITETGWHNAKNSTATHYYTPEALAGVYAPRELLEYYIRGVRRSFVYQLADYRPDPGLTDHEAHFGLLRADLSRKPIFNSLANMIRLLTDGTRTAFTAGALSYGVVGAPSDLRQVLVQKRNGSFVLFLWRDVAIWDPRTRTYLDTNTVNVNVKLARTAKVSTFVPAGGAAARATATATSSVSVPLRGDVVALQITM